MRRDSAIRLLIHELRKLLRLGDQFCGDQSHGHESQQPKHGVMADFLE